MASMATAYPEFPKLNQEPMLRKCTPFCDKNKECPDHHELLVAIVNCTDMLGSLSNLDNLKECVEKYTKGGWGKDDDVPDAVMENRCPLIHWAASLGKCNALEWMLASGFSPVAKSSGNGETALHRAIQLLYKSRPKFTVKELNPKFSKMVGLLKEALLIKDEAHGDTPFHTAASMLVNGDHKPNFFLSCVEVIINKGKKMGDYSDTILNAVNNDGETVLHILARGEKHKVEYCTQAIRSLIVAGADRSIRNNDGQTALDIALAGGTEPLVEELIRSVNIKVEPLDDNEDAEQQIQQLQEEQASSSASCSEFLGNSPLLKHLGEAGLLHDVSALLARARSRDEGNLRKIQSQAKEIDAQVNTKLKEIERMKLEVSSLKLKRKRCDAEVERLHKRLMSCDSALKEIPGAPTGM
ncbi:hypothetical protein pdam_00015033 [Pocillopora damicornis]|uniref:Uncharacterized protein n=1 Tax=Pocillopora damicornis TaxID=46731 RepID=A0A3M6TRV3_POCDA|nr:hypothetical protein pdam_00015033 [Pocillopora damicornis]